MECKLWWHRTIPGGVGYREKFSLNSRFKQADDSCTFSVSEFIPNNWRGNREKREAK